MFGIATEPDARAGSRKEKPTASRPSAFFFQHAAGRYSNPGLGTRFISIRTNPPSTVTSSPLT